MYSINLIKISLDEFGEILIKAQLLPSQRTDYNKTPSETILKSFRELNSKWKFTKATLGISDIDYCRRFCEKLDCDIN